MIVQELWNAQAKIVTAETFQLTPVLWCILSPSRVGFVQDLKLIYSRNYKLPRPRLSPLPFSGRPVYAVAFWTAYLSWIVPEIVASRVKRSTDSLKTRDRGSLELIVGLWWVGMGIDFILAFHLQQVSILWQRSFVFFIGILLMVAGVAFRWYSIAILGRSFTFDVAIHSGQTLMDAGPYRYIRHPSYSGALLTVLGFGLALENWAGLAAFLTCMGCAYAYRIPIEEGALIAGLGEPYRQYMDRTWRLVPFLF